MELARLESISDILAFATEAMKPFDFELHGPVNPVWAIDSFLDHRLYAELLPSIQVASRLMQSPAAEHFCHTVLYGRTEWVDHRETENPTCRRLKRLRSLLGTRHIRDLKWQAKRRVRAEIARMAEQIFHRREKPAAGEDASTEQIPEDVATGMPHGSLIRYSPSIPEELLAQNLSADVRRIEVVHKAFVLLHEFAVSMRASTPHDF